MGDLSDASTEVHAALRRLQQDFERSHNEWNDQVRHNFEQDYIVPFNAHLQAIHREMQQLAALIAKARQQVK